MFKQWLCVILWLGIVEITGWGEGETDFNSLHFKQMEQWDVCYSHEILMQIDLIRLHCIKTTTTCLRQTQLQRNVMDFLSADDSESVWKEGNR